MAEPLDSSLTLDAENKPVTLWIKWEGEWIKFVPAPKEE